MLLFRTSVRTMLIIMSIDVEARIQGACQRSRWWKQKSDPAVTLDVQTGLTTPPKSHYSPAVSCCQVQFVLLAKARRTTRASCWLWQMSSNHVWIKKRRKLPHDDDDDAQYRTRFPQTCKHKSNYIHIISAIRAFNETKKLIKHILLNVLNTNII